MHQTAVGLRHRGHHLQEIFGDAWRSPNNGALVHDELQQIPVGVTDISARALGRS